MGFLDNTKGVLNELFTRPHGELMREGLQSYVDPIQHLMSGKAREEGTGALLGSSANSLLSVLFGAPIAYKALSPDRPDMDSAGPFENMMKRWGQLWGGLAPNSPTLFNKYGLPASIVGGIVASPIAAGLGKYTGRALDYISDNRPSPDEMYKRFNSRLGQEMSLVKAEAPGIDEYSAQQLAVKQFMNKNPDYDLGFLNKGS